MLKLLCLLFIAVVVTHALPAADKLKEDLNAPDSNAAHVPVQAATPYGTIFKPKQGPASEEAQIAGDNKDETLDKSETFGFGWAAPYYGGWGGYGGWHGYAGYGGYGWGRGFYGGWRPYYYWR